MSCGRKLSPLLVATSLLVGCATAPPPPPRSNIQEVGQEATVTKGHAFEGMATFYGKHEHGGPTASGERFNMYALTAAHKTLPMQTRVKCTNLKNGRSVTVRINDRGPYGKGRVIDLSWAAAKELEMLEAGVVPVRCVTVPR
jgi:rare lipoprotein A